MSYYTDILLEVFSQGQEKVSDKLYEEVAKEILIVSGLLFERGIPLTKTQWLSCYEDITKISKKYPDLLIELTGFGQISNDIWRIFFKGGENYTIGADIVFKPFDETLLGW